jgi:DhnA family fructose-bisphosphate aldolase class Ia
VEAVARVVASVGVPVLFLGGPHRDGDPGPVLDEVRDVMAGGGSGLAMGRAIFQEPSPGAMAEQVAEIVHGQ